MIISLEACVSEYLLKQIGHKNIRINTHNSPTVAKFQMNVTLYNFICPQLNASEHAA
jgi:hypothetical protein